MLRPYISGCLRPTSRNAGSVVATSRHRDRGCPGGGRSAGRRVARVRLHAHTLDEMFLDIRRVGEALELRDEAEELEAGLRYRLRRVAAQAQGSGKVGAQHAAPLRKPRVLVLEWLDPPYVAGHWVPELVALAGGQDVGSAPGERSRARPWEELAAPA